MNTGSGAGKTATSWASTSTYVYPVVIQSAAHTGKAYLVFLSSQTYGFSAAASHKFHLCLTRPETTQRHTTSTKYSYTGSAAIGCTVEVYANDFSITSQTITSLGGAVKYTRTPSAIKSSIVAHCNVTFSYTHNGRCDIVNVAYFAPGPSSFKNRFLATSVGGLAINPKATSVAGDVSIGAVSGLTDGGFGDFNTQADVHFLVANGTAKWENAYTFGYRAIHEMTVLVKAFTRNLMVMQESTKLHAYYQGCSESGRVLAVCSHPPFGW
ncbi:uncharacterized protein M421DRAFT_2508 [Didymella exigua CBS 183.55]|uniref:Carboxylic ester hydrolase n=1 Tax=Didymella exigua CBS 183.55 TaxID=1150837 RepID=A0A6A5RXY5_9PLEO|nr:uncharacterized protein M421DRAFT_2508 [Didymella exigua CBS 183.55]KAF1931888.1 hypothetical protein M421DRAFT_2508 [Didymella exigua CBS 183.55]